MVRLQGALDISVNGVKARFEAEAGAMQLDVDDPVAFLKASQFFHRSNISVLKLLAEQLSENGLTLKIVSRNKTLVVIGHEVKSGMAGSILGVPHLEIQAAGLLGRIAS